MIKSAIKGAVKGAVFVMAVIVVAVLVGFVIYTFGTIGVFGLFVAAGIVIGAIEQVEADQ